MSETNTYSYDNSVLSGPGQTENLVRRGFIADPNLVHQPRTGGLDLTPTSISAVNVPQSQVIEGFNKLKTPVWQTLTGTGREYLTYEGNYFVEFTSAFIKEAQEWRENRISNGKGTFTERNLGNGNDLFELGDNDANETIQSRGLNLINQRNSYDTAEEISPYFQDISREVSGESVGYFMLHTLKEHDDEVKLSEDSKLFDQNDHSNTPDLFFGGQLTHGDVGFYIDMGGRLRATYDTNYIYKTKPLLEDLIQYGDPEDYAVGTFPNGTTQFVVSKNLTNLLLENAGSHYLLAMRYNNPKIVFEGFDITSYPQFEDILDVTTNEYLSASKLFGVDDPSEKK